VEKKITRRKRNWLQPHLGKKTITFKLRFSYNPSRKWEEKKKKQHPGLGRNVHTGVMSNKLQVA
jgi:hypothetical protein